MLNQEICGSGRLCKDFHIGISSCNISFNITQLLLATLAIQWHAKVWEPLAENVNNFNKIREIIQNACYFLFSTVLSKIFYIKYVYI